MNTRRDKATITSILVGLIVGPAAKVLQAQIQQAVPFDDPAARLALWHLRRLERAAERMAGTHKRSGTTGGSR